MTREEFLKQKINEGGYSFKSYASHINMPYTTLMSILKNVGGASIDNIVKICGGLSISINQLEELADVSKKLDQEALPQLTQRDENQIVKDLEKMMGELDNTNAFAAHGGVVDVDDEEDRELLKASLLASMKLAKRLAKQKYTPKKHRK